MQTYVQANSPASSGPQPIISSSVSSAASSIPSSSNSGSVSTKKNASYKAAPVSSASSSETQSLGGVRSNVAKETTKVETGVSSKQGRSNDAEHTDVTENYKGHMVDYNHDVVRDTMLIPNNINQWGEENYELTGYINDVNTEYTQVLMEYSKSETVNNIYEYGIQRESMSWYGRKGYYAYDGRGSVADVTGSASQTMIQYKYNNYGETSSLVNGYNNYVRNPYWYNAERTDEVAGVPDQQYLRARYYNANTGRFLTSDTYLGNTYDPLSLSLYAYCGNNPVNYTDPSGNTPLSSDGDYSSMKKPSTRTWLDDVYDVLNNLSVTQEIKNFKNKLNSLGKEIVSYIQELLNKANQYSQNQACMPPSASVFLTGVGVEFGRAFNKVGQDITYILPLGFLARPAFDNLENQFDQTEYEWVDKGYGAEYYAGALLADIITTLIGTVGSINGLLDALGGITISGGGAAAATAAAPVTITIAGVVVVTGVATALVSADAAAFGLSQFGDNVTNFKSEYSKVNSKTSMDFMNKVEQKNGRYVTDKDTLNEIGRIESRNTDYSKLKKEVRSTRPPSEGGKGTSTVYKYSDEKGVKFVVHEVTDANGNIIHRDYDAVRIPSGQLIEK